MSPRSKQHTTSFNLISIIGIRWTPVRHSSTADRSSIMKHREKVRNTEPCGCQLRTLVPRAHAPSAHSQSTSTLPRIHSFEKTFKWKHMHGHLTGLSKRPPARRGGSVSFTGAMTTTNPCTSPGASLSGRDGFAIHEALNTRARLPGVLAPARGGCSIDRSSPCFESEAVRLRVKRKKQWPHFDIDEGTERSKRDAFQEEG